jgi:hypothetical protein
MKPSWRSISTMPPLRSRRMSLSVLDCLPLDLVNCCFDLVNTIYAIFSCTLARRRFHVLAIHGLPRHPVPRSKPPCLSITAAGPSARTRLTFSIAADCLNAQHLHPSLAKRYVVLQHTHAKISLKLNQSLVISLTIIQHSSHMDTSTMCSQNVRFVAWITSSRGHVSCTRYEKSWTRCMTDKFIWFSPIYQYIQLMVGSTQYLG